MTIIPVPPVHSDDSPYSTAPWTYAYSPYTRTEHGRAANAEIGNEIPAFEIFDAEGNKLFDTNEDSPEALQEANARLAAAAPQLLEALRRCILLLADHDGHDGEEGDVYRLCLAAAQVADMGRLDIRAPAGR